MNPDGMPGRALDDPGRLHTRSRRMMEAEEAFDEARVLAKQRNDVVREAEALMVRGVILRERGEYADAADDLADSAALAQAVDDRLLMAEIARETGELHRMEGRLDDARAAFGRALDFYGALGARHAREEVARRLDRWQPEDGGPG
jgi:tetratricopeptide (TPR) repeat protein